MLSERRLKKKKKKKKKKYPPPPKIKNDKTAYQLVKDLTSEKQGRSQLSSTGLGNVIPKNKRVSADGQNIAQICTTMRVVVTRQYWTAVSPRKKICNRPP